MPGKLVQMLRRRALVLSIVASAVVGAGGGVAFAAGFLNPQYQHTALGWNHGIDDAHVYMTHDSASGVGTGKVNTAYACVGSDGGDFGATTYTNHHVHTDGYNGWVCDTSAGEITGISPPLSKHSHW